MLPVYYTTTNTRKRKKSKKTQSQIAAEKEHEKFLKKMGIGSRSSVGSEQRSSKPWVTGSSPVESANIGDKCYGSTTDSKPVGRGSIPRSPAKSQTRSSVWSERTAHNGYVTGSNPVGSTNKISYDPSMAKKEEKVYTGTEIIGIAQMHKSNAVPVRGKKQATEVATMRRN